MFIERLKICAGELVIRDIEFHKGLNLIVDETPSEDLRRTGNNVGKTTVLKLIDFCLGAKPGIIFTDPEDKSSKYELVERFLCEREVLVTLILTDGVGDPTARRVTIERNFLQRNRAVRRINGEQVNAQDFDRKLGEAILPRLSEGTKPTFRQAIGHNVRYDPLIMESTLKTLGPYGSGVEYEALYLFLLGLPHVEAGDKQALVSKRTAERGYLKRLLNGHSVSDYRTVLAQTEREVAALEERRRGLSIEEDYVSKLEELDETKAKISRTTTEISQIDLRITLMEEARRELLGGVSRIDLAELEALYKDAKAFVPELHRSFESLVEFHNTMIHERIEFVTQDLPTLRQDRAELQASLDVLMARIRGLSEDLALLPTSEQMEALIDELGEKMRQKGDLEARLSQVEASESRIADLTTDIDACERDIYLPEHEALVRSRLEDLNDKFSQVSQRLYGETYMIGVDIKTDKRGNRYYDFHTLDLNNYSTGKKQGEVLSFDIAYTMFADSKGIGCLHFLLNDRKELMHGNQLLSVGEFVGGTGCQLVVSILQDKLPSDPKLEGRIVLHLSQDDKLFRIEELV